MLSLFLIQSSLFWAGDAPLKNKSFYAYRLPDRAFIKVYFDEKTLKENGESRRFAKEVLKAAVMAYNTLTRLQGFSTPGYSFAEPDKNYAHDPDNTLDIYIGDPKNPNENLPSGIFQSSFKDAPCFDTQKISETAYQAVILIPANYREFIKSWEKVNPSPLGKRNTRVDLQGTLIHEMTHALLFYYNKNLSQEKLPRLQQNDWYVEGLARYFETFVGAKHDFFSKGFKETLPTKIRFSRGGSNYFMRYPDQNFTGLRYENALFWRFMDTHFGVHAIEKISREFRTLGEKNPSSALEKVTGETFDTLLKQFAMAMLLKNFGLKEDGIYLKEVAKTHLFYEHHRLYLLDGFGTKKLLGRRCRTDWVGGWDSAKAKFGSPSVAGDSTAASDVAGWATDFYEISFAEPNPDIPPGFSIHHTNGEGRLVTQILLTTKTGNRLSTELSEISAGDKACFNFVNFLGTAGLKNQAIKKINLLITNTSPKSTSEYEIILNF